MAEAYRQKLMRALENADYLSPVAAYQKELFKVDQALAKLRGET